ncbi:M20 aminoacylase family protein [Paenirhodobacter sp.]|uniref:M20 aminoacylase family protein n=1 Tax=Paenirhodobacter sp. TaxID=1965326 RepID=UPI003B41E804
MTIADAIAVPQGTAQDRIAETIGEFIALRQELHHHPELAFREQRTATRIAALLEGWGYNITRLAGTGVIGTLRNGPGRALAIRADIDALPIHEATGLPFASNVPGVMHACGHDGHTAILLAAARYLAETRRFHGSLHVIFQPAEEVGQGARRLISEGLFDLFPVDAIFGLHNWPGVEAGRFGFISGPAMAAIDRVDFRVRGKGGHGAAPHEAVDPVVAAAQAITALQSVVSRNVNPLEAAVVTVGSIHGGTASNVIPDSVDMQLTLRSFSSPTREVLARRVPALLSGIVEALGAEAVVDFRPGFPPVVNHAAEVSFARDVARAALGEDAVLPALAPRTASEDFAWYLAERPGAFLFLGNGEGAPLHSPEYRFNDAIILPGATLWAELAERFLTHPGANQ